MRSTEVGDELSWSAVKIPASTVQPKPDEWKYRAVQISADGAVTPFSGQNTKNERGGGVPYDEALEAATSRYESSKKVVEAPSAPISERVDEQKLNDSSWLQEIQGRDLAIGNGSYDSASIGVSGLEDAGLML